MKHSITDMNNQTNTRSVFTLGWVIATVMFPIVGFIAGIVYANKKRDGASDLIILSIVVTVWFVIGVLI